jgi:hypothetical protein
MKILNKINIVNVIKNPKSALPLVLLKLGIFDKLIHFTDYIFDYSINIKTSNIVTNSDLYAIDPLSQNHATHCGPYPVFMLWMLKGTFKKYSSSHFIDIGLERKEFVSMLQKCFKGLQAYFFHQF